MLYRFFISLTFAMTLFATIIAITSPELTKVYTGVATFFAFSFMFALASGTFGGGSKVEGGSASGGAKKV